MKRKLGRVLVVFELFYKLNFLRRFGPATKPQRGFTETKWQRDTLGQTHLTRPIWEIKSRRLRSVHSQHPRMSGNAVSDGSNAGVAQRRRLGAQARLAGQEHVWIRPNSLE